MSDTNPMLTLARRARVSYAPAPDFRIERVGGEDHKPLFRAICTWLPEKVTREGTGHSKMEAKRNASAAMLVYLDSRKTLLATESSSACFYIDRTRDKDQSTATAHDAPSLACASPDDHPSATILEDPQIRTEESCTNFSQADVKQRLMLLSKIALDGFIPECTQGAFPDENIEHGNEIEQTSKSGLTVIVDDASRERHSSSSDDPLKDVSGRETRNQPNDQKSQQSGGTSGESTLRRSQNTRPDVEENSRPLFAQNSVPESAKPQQEPAKQPQPELPRQSQTELAQQLQPGLPRLPDPELVQHPDSRPVDFSSDLLHSISQGEQRAEGKDEPEQTELLPASPRDRKRQRPLECDISGGSSASFPECVKRMRTVQILIRVDDVDAIRAVSRLHGQGYANKLNMKVRAYGPQGDIPSKSSETIPEWIEIRRVGTDDADQVADYELVYWAGFDSAASMQNGVGRIAIVTANPDLTGLSFLGQVDVISPADLEAYLGTIIRRF